ncbi:metallophosphoesterase [Marimonas sp. MJW-29]|uniref:Metallophosphoesterase n=1 Tax=Sulfitobacter sediminis TaxID=3234186 RepID=A0ABV3RTD1_9RHOB
MYDIIPDIHGQATKLKAALRDLGYSEKNGAWRHSDPRRHVIYLGDFIDRGPDNREVIHIVRGMIEAGTAFAVMGNHELNAIHFHTADETGPLRAHSEKNIAQHASFLKEFPLGSPEASEAIAWMKELPLYLEFDGFRAVHACWDEAGIGQLKQQTTRGVLSEGQLVRAAAKEDVLFELVETALKGPELQLPDGYFFVDKGDHHRTEVRRKWWDSNVTSWRDVAISVPKPEQLPDQKLPDRIITSAYPSDAPPVFFGHYWMQGNPVLQAKNALCLDYSAGLDGPLVSYEARPGQNTLSLEWLRVHQ